MNENLIQELRQMFIDGATPSKLMSYLAEVGKDSGKPLHFMIMDTFREAFGIAQLRIPPQEDDAHPNFRYPQFNRDVLPHMALYAKEQHPDSLTGSWLEDLTIRSQQKHEERLRNSKVEALSRVWDDLNEKEKDFILRKVAKADYFWDVIKILAWLLERMQQKNDELESQQLTKAGS
jgi:hypothetical protein